MTIRRPRGKRGPRILLREDPRASDEPAGAAIVDVGGGNGALLAGILDATPALRGVVFDQPHVAERESL